MAGAHSREPLHGRCPVWRMFKRMSKRNEFHAPLEPSMISKWIKGMGIAVAGIGNLVPTLAAASDYNLQTPQTVIAREIYDLHTLIFVICCVIFVIVFG